MQTKNTKNTSFSLNKEVLKEFDKYCKENAINKSKWVEMHMRQLLKSAALKQ